MPGGIKLTLRLTPRGGRDVIDGIVRLADGRHVLKARVRAVAEDGAANAAAVALVAGIAGVPKSAVRIEAGHAARLKTLIVTGDGLALADALLRACGPEAEN